MKKLEGKEIVAVKAKLKRLAKIHLGLTKGRHISLAQAIKGSGVKYITATRWFEKYKEMYLLKEFKKKVLA